MKNSKFVLIALMLICASSLFAQDLHRGDTIRILPPTDKHYMTSERMSNWVYSVNHVIQQVGGVRFPEGVLIQGIYSWVKPEFIRVVSPYVENDSIANMSAEERTAYEAQLAEERRIQDSIAHARAEEEALTYAELRRQQDSIAAAQKAEDERLIAYQDSLKRAMLDSLEESMAPKLIHRFTIGVRGGAASMMQNMGEVGKGKVGFDVALDLQYAHYWKTKKEHNVGILVGASAAFARNNVKGSTVRDFNLPSCDGEIAYHITGDVENLAMNEVQVEVPVMFSMVTKGGFFLNVGPKLMVPVYSFYKQDLSGASIAAKFVKEDVTVIDKPVTGVFVEDQKVTKGKWQNAAIHLMLAGELGYEFKLKNNNSFGLGVYGGYSVYNNYDNHGDLQPSHVQITVPTATSKANVNVVCASDVYMNKLGYWDAGLKLAYHFNWYQKPHKK